MDQETADILKRMAELLERVVNRARLDMLLGDIKALQRDIAELAGESVGAPTVIGITHGTTGADMSGQPAGGDDGKV